MGIPTEKAGPKGPLKEMGATTDQRRGYSMREMPPPEHVRRWDRLAAEKHPGREVPDKIRR